MPNQRDPLLQSEDDPTQSGGGRRGGGGAWQERPSDGEPRCDMMCIFYFLLSCIILMASIVGHLYISSSRVYFGALLDGFFMTCGFMSFLKDLRPLMFIHCTFQI